MEIKSKKSQKYLSLLVILSLVFGFSCSDDDPAPMPPQEENIIEIASGNDQFSTLVAAIQRADLVGALSGTGPFTVFAPTNQAFTNAGITNVNAIPVEDLRNILLYHVVAGRVMANQVTTGEVPTLLEGANLNVLVSGGNIVINENVNVTTGDITASNGVIHVIDGILIPEEESNSIADIVIGNENFSTLLAAVVAAELDEALLEQGPFTVFAPTNAAFERFFEVTGLTAGELLGSPDLATILSYHVVPGEVPASAVEPGSVTTLEGSPFFVSVDPDGGIWINGNAQIEDTDIEADNGIIHVIDYVITPPTQSIAEIAVEIAESEMPEFTQLVGALVRADLVGAVSGGFDDNLTVFAPTDLAFEALYEALNVDGFEDIPLETLTAVLTYHVVPARAFSQDLREGAELPTLQGDNLIVNLADLKINESGLVPELLNIHATNGVIHVIDSVLIP